MGTWNEYLQKEGTPPEWPYPIKFGEETEISISWKEVIEDVTEEEYSEEIPEF